MAVKKEDVIAYLEKANMMEISELISEIEEKFGVSAAAPLLQRPLVLMEEAQKKLSLMFHYQTWVATKLQLLKL